MASKHGIAVGGGVIDTDYTGEVKVRVGNHENTGYQFMAGDCITQPVIERIHMQDAREIAELDKTERGTEGFGSSDIGPKRLITSEEFKVTMWILNPKPAR